MSDPFSIADSMLLKTPGQSETGSAVDEFAAADELLLTPSGPVAPTPEPVEPPMQGFISSAISGVIGSAKAIKDIAVGLPKFFLIDLPTATGFRSAGLTQEQLSNPIIRARLVQLGADPNKIVPVTNKEQIMAGPLEFGQSVIMAPIEEAHAAWQSTNPEEAARHAATAAFLGLGAIEGGVRGVKELRTPLKPEFVINEGALRDAYSRGSEMSRVGKKPPVGAPQRPAPTGDVPITTELGQGVFDMRAMAEAAAKEAAKKAKVRTPRQIANTEWRRLSTQGRMDRFGVDEATAKFEWSELPQTHRKLAASIVEQEQVKAEIAKAAEAPAPEAPAVTTPPPPPEEPTGGAPAPVTPTAPVPPTPEPPAAIAPVAEPVAEAPPDQWHRWNPPPPVTPPSEMGGIQMTDRQGRTHSVRANTESQMWEIKVTPEESQVMGTEWVPLPVGLEASPARLAQALDQVKVTPPVRSLGADAATTPPPAVQTRTSALMTELVGELRNMTDEELVGLSNRVTTDPSFPFDRQKVADAITAERNTRRTEQVPTKAPKKNAKPRTKAQRAADQAAARVDVPVTELPVKVELTPEEKAKGVANRQAIDGWKKQISKQWPGWLDNAPDKMEKLAKGLARGEEWARETHEHGPRTLAVPPTTVDRVLAPNGATVEAPVRFKSDIIGTINVADLGAVVDAMERVEKILTPDFQGQQRTQLVSDVNGLLAKVRLLTGETESNGGLLQSKWDVWNPQAMKIEQIWQQISPRTITAGFKGFGFIDAKYGAGTRAARMFTTKAMATAKQILGMPEWVKRIEQSIRDEGFDPATTKEFHAAAAAERVSRRAINEHDLKAKGLPDTPEGRERLGELQQMEDVAIQDLRKSPEEPTPPPPPAPTPPPAPEPTPAPTGAAPDPLEPAPTTPPPPENVAKQQVTRDVWKDPADKMWVRQWKDGEGNQVGNSERFPTKKLAMADPLPAGMEEVKALKKPVVPKAPNSALNLVDSGGPLIDKTLYELDRLIDKLDEIPTPNEELLVKDLERIAAAKKVIRAKDVVAVPTTESPMFPHLDTPRESLIAARDAGKRAGGVEGNQMVADANQGLRFQKDMGDFSQDKLEGHVLELRAMAKAARGAEREKIAKRLADAEELQRARQASSAIDAVPVIGEKPSPSIVKNERGSIQATPDPLERDPSFAGDPESIKRTHDRLELRKPVVGTGSLAQWWKRARFMFERFTLPAEEFDKIMAQGGHVLAEHQKVAPWAQALSGWVIRAEEALTDRWHQWNHETGELIPTNVRGYKKILQNLRGKLKYLRTFEVSAHTIDLAKTGKVTGIELADAIRNVEWIKANHPEVVAAAAESVAFRNEGLKYWANSGGMSTKVLTLLIDLYKNFVPLHRVLEGKDVPDVARTIIAEGRKLRTVSGVSKSPIHKLIGGMQKILDPIQITVDMTRRLIRAADKNMVARRLVEAAKARPDLATGLIERVPTKEAFRLEKALNAQESTVMQLLKKQMESKGIKADDASVKDLVRALTQRELGRGNDVLHVWIDGKREAWRIHPQLAQMFEAMGPGHVGVWTKLAAVPARVFRGGIVNNPAFWAFNYFKDSLEATMRSEYGFMPWDSVIGLAHSLSGTHFAQMLGIKPTELFRQFKSGGGGFSPLSGVLATTTEAATRAVLPGRSPLAPVMHPIEVLKRLSEPFEEAARLGEFRLARKAGRSVFDASLAAKNVSVDFNMHGANMQAASMMIAFLNPAIQSLSADMRAIRRNPGRIAVIGSGLAVASVLNWYANRDDKELNDLRKTKYGALFTWWRLPDGTIAKTPKPYMFGQLFMTGAERALDTMLDKDPDAVREFGKSLSSAMLFNVLPNWVNYGLGVAMNKDIMTGTPIVPAELQDLEPQFQVKANTNLASRKLGEWFAPYVSPIQIDYFVQSIFGAIGRDVNKSFTIALKTDQRMPDPVDSELPWVGRFFGHYPSQNVEPIYTFYNRALDYETINKTVLYLGKHEPEKLPEYMQHHVSELALASVYAEARAKMAEVRAAIKSFDDLPSEFMSTEDRRQRKDQLLRAMIEIARLSNKMADRIKAAPAQTSTP